MQRSLATRLFERLSACVGLAALLVAAAACRTASPTDGLSFRAARYLRLQAQHEYRACVDEGIALAARSEQTTHVARYLAGARMLEGCEAALAENADSGMRDQRFRVLALTAQNYLMAGDIGRSREVFGRLRSEFPRRDLFYADGSSYVDTMRVLLRLVDTDSRAKLVTLNIGDELHSEMLRAARWKHR